MLSTQISAASNGKAMGGPAGCSASKELLMPANSLGHHQPGVLGESGQRCKIWPAWLSPVVPGMQRTNTQADAEGR